MHEALVFGVENVIHQSVPEQAAHPQSGHKQSEIAAGKGGNIQCRDRRVRQAQVEQPPVEEEQRSADGQRGEYLAPRYALALHADCAHAGYG